MEKNNRSNGSSNRGNGNKSNGYRKNGRKKTYFWKLYAGITVLALVLIAGMWTVLWKFLAAYEGAQPEYAVESLLTSFENADTDELMNYITFDPSALESQQVLTDYVTAKLGEGKWEYSKKMGEYSKETPVYNIKKDGTHVASVSLQKSSQTGAFKTAKWDVSKVDNIVGDAQDYTIMVPQNSQVTVNGVLLDASYVTADNVESSNLGNVTKYIQAPKLTTYQVSGLLMKPVVRVTGPVYQSALEPELEENNQFVYGFESNEDLKQQQEGRVIEITKTYGNYVTNDVKYDALSKYILSGSYAVTYLKNIGKTNIWTAAHSANTYDDLKVYNYQSYTDTCYSCEVTFNLVIHTATQDVTYPTHIKYVFIKSGNTWYVADMSLK